MGGIFFFFFGADHLGPEAWSLKLFGLLSLGKTLQPEKVCWGNVSHAPYEGEGRFWESFLLLPLPREKNFVYRGLRFTENDLCNVNKHGGKFEWSINRNSRIPGSDRWGVMCTDYAFGPANRSGWYWGLQKVESLWSWAMNRNISASKKSWEKHPANHWKRQCAKNVPGCCAYKLQVRSGAFAENIQNILLIWKPLHVVSLTQKHMCRYAMVSERGLLSNCNLVLIPRW